MQDAKSHTEHFICLEQVSDVRSAIVLACRASAALLYRSVVCLKSRILEIHLAMLRVHMGVSSISGWIYAIEEINTSVDRLKYICRSSNTHEVCRSVLRQIRNGHIEYVVHLLCCLSYCKSSYGISRKIKLADSLGVIYSDILVYGTLIDSKQ